MAVTVAPAAGTSTVERWQNETPYLIDDIGQFLALDSESCVLDYGCGTGRVAKGLIEKYGGRVIGVDTSLSMRVLAPHYVRSERFLVWSPEVLDKKIETGFRADHCVCVWVIQHALSAADVIDRISRALKPGGLLYALNQRTHCVPTTRGWLDDGVDVRAELCRVFSEEHIHPLPDSVSTPELSAISMIQLLRKPAA